MSQVKSRYINWKLIDSRTLSGLITGMLLVTITSNTFAQMAPLAQPVAPAASELRAQAVALQTATTRAPEKTKGDFVANNAKVWSALLAQCGVVNDNCANAAIFAASTRMRR